MRIAVLTYRFPALSETFVLNQVTGLLDRGHDVQVFPIRAGEAGPVHPAWTTYGLAERTHHVPRPAGRWARWAAAAGYLAQDLRRGSSVLLRAARPSDPALRGLLFPAAAAITRRHHDVLHCHFGPVGLWALRLLRLGVLTGRLVVTFHGYDLARHRYTAAHYAPLFAAAARVLAVTEAGRQRLLALGCPAEKIVIHPMGIDLDRFAAVPLPSEAGPLRVVSVARLVEKKGLDDGIRAVASLPPEVPVRYEILGDGPLRASLAALIETLGVADRVVLLGPQPQPVVQAHLAQAHVLLAPSRTAADGDQEGLPVAIMEAMAVGRPVVATQHSGIPELVVHGETGLLAEEGDTGHLRDHLAYLAGHPAIQAQMGHAGRLRLLRQHNIHRLNDRLVALFETL